LTKEEKMKEKKLRKNLALNKATIANLSLSANEMKHVIGATVIGCITTKTYSIMQSCKSYCPAGCLDEPIST
jgi:hypothetical protein